MAFREAIRIALQSLWANKLRSVLTLIGMVIGVASVIMVMTLVAGVNKFVATKIYGYGADVFTASKQPSVVFSDAEYMKYQKRKDLKYDAYEAIVERCVAAGLVWGEELYIDATKMAANAALASITPRFAIAARAHLDDLFAIDAGAAGPQPPLGVAEEPVQIGALYGLRVDDVVEKHNPSNGGLRCGTGKRVRPISERAEIQAMCVAEGAPRGVARHQKRRGCQPNIQGLPCP